ncbi:MAG: DHH family phosphoesterase [Bacteroidaceae bacterium]|nr:DHH family phosphoesterase [Bacteroidaceae bacterium]
MFQQYLSQEQVQEWNRLVAKAHNIVLFGHVSPDGDAMGSTLALADSLKRQEKKVNVIMPNAFPDFLSWLPGASDVINYEYNRGAAAKLIEGADLMFCLDFNALARLEHMQPVVSARKAPIIMVDHHLDPHCGARILISDSEASSTCEMIYCILIQLYGLEGISNEMAQCIYCGMMTDTGSFTYNSNRCSIFYIISQLLTKGIDKDKIYRNVYHSYSLNRLRLEGHIVHDKMQYFSEHHTALFTLTREEMKAYHFKKGDAEGLVNLPLRIKDTKLSISLREDTEKPLIRVSLRSVDDFPCNRMAEDFFRGGGHLNAAGGSLSMTMAEAVEQAHKAIEAYEELLRDAENMKERSVEDR